MKVLIFLVCIGSNLSLEMLKTSERNKQKEAVHTLQVGHLEKLWMLLIKKCTPV